MKKLGFGLMRLPTQSAQPEDIDHEQLCRMVDMFLAHGFTYFDTSYMYHEGASEDAIRKALVERYSRDRFLLADKLPTFMIDQPVQMEVIFEEQLKKGGVSYFDYYMLHCVWESRYDAQIKDCDMFGFARRLKEEGRIRHLGFSFHDSPEALDRILTEHPEVEFVQIALNYYDWDSEAIQSRRCYEFIRKHGKDVIVMQPVKGGMLTRVPESVRASMNEVYPGMSPASWALRFAAGLEGVLVVLSGMSNMAQMEENLSFMTDFQPLDEQRAVPVLRQAVEALKQEKAVACTQCGKCDAICPHGISISDILATYNSIMRQESPTFNAELNYYKRIQERRHGANLCDNCGKCSAVCPKHLDVATELRRTAKFQYAHSFW